MSIIFQFTIKTLYQNYLDEVSMSTRQLHLSLLFLSFSLFSCLESMDSIELTAVDQALEGEISLTMPPLEAGVVADIIVTGAEADERAILIRGTGSGDGSCPAALGGSCLGVTGSISMLARDRVDTTGTAEFHWPVPPGVPSGMEFCMQAFIKRGIDGADSVLSNVVCDAVCSGDECDDDCPGVLYDGVCLSWVWLDEPVDLIPEGCTPFQPPMGWEEEDYFQICEGVTSDADVSMDCTAVDDDWNGGQCDNHEAIVSWETEAVHADIWVHTSTFNYDPTFGDTPDDCVISDVPPVLGVYVCAENNLTLDLDLDSVPGWIDCDDADPAMGEDCCALGEGPLCPPENSCDDVPAPQIDQCDSGVRWQVSPDGSGDSTTIQGAIDMAGDCDVIEIGPGTYAETLMISRPLSLIGEDASLVSVTNGVEITGNFEDLLFSGLTLMGDGPSGGNAVVENNITSEPLGDVSVLNCILDGEDTPGRWAFSPYSITGSYIWDNNEIRNFVDWYVLDNTNSGNAPPYKLSQVIFTNNYVHDIHGAVAFRGKIGEEIDHALVAGNTGIYDGLPSSDSMCWSFVEVNNVVELEIYDNYVSGIPETSWLNEGQAFQIWSVAPWTVDIHDNVMVGNYQGIFIKGYLPHEEGYPLYVPEGAIYNNVFLGNVDFGLYISDNPPALAASSAIGGPLNAENNFWGSATGPTHPDNPEGDGDVVSDNVLYGGWFTNESDVHAAEAYCGAGIPLTD
jgi:hypothetical protein